MTSRLTETYTHACIPAQVSIYPLASVNHACHIVFTGKSVPQVALRWLLQRPAVSSVIVGAKKLSQLDDNMGAVGWSLTDEEVIICESHSMLLCLYNFDRYT